MGVGSAVDGFLVRWHTKSASVVLIGLDGGGKTTIFNHLTGRPDKKIIPTVGISKPRIVRAPFWNVKLFDMGGTASFRAAWTDRLKKSHAAIFVVDASNKTRLIEARDEFNQYLRSPDFAGKPIVILLNKADCGDLSEKQVEDYFQLNDLTQSSWRIIACVGLKTANHGQIDPRLRDAVRWIQESMYSTWPQLSRRVRAATRILDKEEKARQKQNKKSVALKRKNAKKKQIVPAQSIAHSTGAKQPTSPVPTIVTCKNKKVLNGQRVDCVNAATKRTATTGWQPFCEECFQAALGPSSPVMKSPIQAIEAQGQRSPHSPKHRLKEFVDSDQTKTIHHPVDDDRKRAKKEKKKRKKERREKKKGPEFIFFPLKVGDRVEANFKGKGKWFPGQISVVNGDGTYGVQYDDGDYDKNVLPMNVCPLGGPILPEGTKVQVRYKGKTNFFRGIIEGMNADGLTYTVTFDDGDSDANVRRSWIRVLNS